MFRLGVTGEQRRFDSDLLWIIWGGIQALDRIFASSFPFTTPFTRPCQYILMHILEADLVWICLI